MKKKQNTQKGYIIPLLFVAIALIGGGAYMISQKKDRVPVITQNRQEQETVQEKEETQNKEEQMQEVEEQENQNIATPPQLPQEPYTQAECERFVAEYHCQEGTETTEGLVDCNPQYLRTKIRCQAFLNGEPDPYGGNYGRKEEKQVCCKLEPLNPTASPWYEYEKESDCVNRDAELGIVGSAVKSVVDERFCENQEQDTHDDTHPDALDHYIFGKNLHLNSRINVDKIQDPNTENHEGDIRAFKVWSQFYGDGTGDDAFIMILRPGTATCQSEGPHLMCADVPYNQVSAVVYTDSPIMQSLFQDIVQQLSASL